MPPKARRCEWWYFDTKLDDGGVVVVTFSDNIDGMKQREVSVEDDFAFAPYAGHPASTARPGS